MTQTLHAVVSDESLTTSSGGRVKLSRPVRHISELELLGQRTGITHFWIMPNSHAAGLGHEFFTDRDGYNIFQTKDATGALFECPQSGRCRKLSSGHEILVCYPAKAFWWVANEAADILAAIDCLSSIFKITIQWSPIHLGHTLLRQSVRESWLAESTIPLYSLPFNDAAKDIHYFRPLTLDAVGQWWHEYDRNSHYLAGCTGVDVGTGTPAHLQENELYRGGYIDGAIESGVYRVEVLDASKWCGQLPPIINGNGWVTADVLEYAIKQGYDVAVREGWVFPESHQILRQWAETLWKARTVLHPSNTQFSHKQGQTNAYYTIKDIATSSVGAFGIRNDKHKFARNNWRSDVIGKSNVTMLYHLKKYADMGYFPHFVNVDAAGYISPVASPMAAVPGIMARADKLGGFKHENSLLLTEEIMQQAIAVQKKESVRAAYKFLRKLAKGGTK
jgi:hypothetical protein